MHYDIDKGVKDTRGLFSRLTVVVLSGLLVLFGLYMTVNWFAPDIFYMVSNNHAAIENIVKNQPVVGDILRIPVLEIEREIVPKKAEGKIQLTEKNGRIILSGAWHSLGVTPFDTKFLSPLALSSRATPDMRIYVDLNGARLAYRATEVIKNSQPNPNPSQDLTIYALDNSGTTAAVEIRAEKLGEVKI
ncbi:MAG: hypothetical protein LBU20_02235 [Candidatus Nomurabacteria bacterium]|jgi:hypothetical protein|nr:hypothetical protein [Candidatus Nomurabacteria bacterium]